MLRACPLRGCLAIALVALTLLGQSSAVLAADPIGTTRIAKWKEDRKAVFLVMFDDSWPSHFQVAVPALVERNMIATFYINPGKGEYLKFKDKWEKEIWKTGMVYGNHTLTHKGVKDMTDAEKEIGEPVRLITEMVPGKNPRLISYAQPGVPADAWKITPEQRKELLDKYHLIDRPTFAGHGAVYHWKTTEQMLALADKAIAAGEMEYLVIHGLERRPPLNWGYQDFWPLNQDIYHAVLDGLKERRDRGDLWITDHISYHQYLTERSTAEVKVLETSANAIRLQLKSSADPQFYDYPLTLITRVPNDWTTVRVEQGDSTVTVTAKEGVAQFDALPGPTPIKLTQQKN